MVVGAGPTGMMLAGELVRTRAIGARRLTPRRRRASCRRAVGVHARTLEILDEFGVADDLVARGHPGRRRDHVGGRQADRRRRFYRASITRFPFVLCVSQVETEAVLRELLELRGGRVERSTELISLEQGRRRRSTTMLRSARGEERVARGMAGRLRPGAHSAVRKSPWARASPAIPTKKCSSSPTFALNWDAPTDRVSTYFDASGAAAYFPLKAGTVARDGHRGWLSRARALHSRT